MLKASALHAPLRALAAKDAACAAKVESVTRRSFCNVHCLERRTASRPATAVQQEPPSSLNATTCEFWRHLARVVSWCGFLPPTHSRGLLSLLQISLNASVVMKITDAKALIERGSSTARGACMGGLERDSVYRMSGVASRTLRSNRYFRSLRRGLRFDG